MLVLSKNGGHGSPIEQIQMLTLITQLTLGVWLRIPMPGIQTTNHSKICEYAKSLLYPMQLSFYVTFEGDRQTGRQTRE